MVPLSRPFLLFRRITLDYTKYALLFITTVLFLRLFFQECPISLLPTPFSVHISLPTPICVHTWSTCYPSPNTKANSSLKLPLTSSETSLRFTCLTQNSSYSTFYNQQMVRLTLHSLYLIGIGLMAYNMHLTKSTSSR